MTHGQFYIGLEFWCGGRRWRCTDVGSRVIVAISLEPHEVVETERSPRSPKEVRERRCVTNDHDWLNGPPFAIAEEVFDEYAIEGCSLSPEDGVDEGTVG